MVSNFFFLLVDSLFSILFSVCISLVAQTVKCLPTMWETQVQSLGQEDPLEKEMATQLQYSCLGNPRDRGAWWATIHGVAKEVDMTYRLGRQTTETNMPSRSLEY